MASDNPTELARLKDRISEMLKRVPRTVTAGGLETVKAYKESVKFAQKYVTAPRATLLNLQTAYTKLASYEG